jgi:hypothetical protein
LSAATADIDSTDASAIPAAAVSNFFIQHLLINYNGLLIVNS